MVLSPRKARRSQNKCSRNTHTAAYRNIFGSSVRMDCLENSDRFNNGQGKDEGLFSGSDKMQTDS